MSTDFVSRLSQVDERLRQAYRPSRLRNPRDPLSDLIFLLLASQTEEYNYVRTYAELRRRFPTWRAVLRAGVDPVYHAIRRGGLARKKAQQIIAILRAVTRGDTPTLRWLRRLDDLTALAALESLPGVGPKTARCVLVYALDRAAFPLDTHVWRILRRLGLVRAGGAPARRDAVLVEQAVPKRIRARLHVNLVQHGRRVCTAARPRCGECVLADLCPRVGVEPDFDQQRRLLAMRARRTKDIVDRELTRKEVMHGTPGGAAESSWRSTAAELRSG